MKKIIIIFALFLTGCSGMNYAIQHYSDTTVERYTYNGQVFRVFDKPKEGRLMITPSLSRSALQGFTYGAAATAENTYQEASTAYLVSKGRDCTVSDLKLIVQPQWEAFYNCQ